MLKSATSRAELSNPSGLAAFAEMTPRDQFDVLEPCGKTVDELRRLADEHLMAHLQAGHADVLAIIFERYYRLVLSVGMKILRDVGEAEDVMQVVFLEVFQTANAFSTEKGTLKMWILQYAYHRAMDRKRHLNVRNFYKNGEVGEVANELVDLANSGFNRHEARQLIAQALATLNDVQSRVLKMAYFEGLSLKEIAERTDESLGNVRHHYYRGLSRLRAVINEQPRKDKVQFGKQEPADAST